MTDTLPLPIILLPTHITNLLNDLDNLRNKVVEHKKHTDQLALMFNMMDKKLSKYLQKEIKTIMKKQEKKGGPRGFAMPINVSTTLCNFMEQPPNTKISRTDATKFLANYIKVNNLIDPNDKKRIIPNDTLWQLIGDDARIEEESLDRFNIQKYLNHHFTLKPSNGNPIR